MRAMMSKTPCGTLPSCALPPTFGRGRFSISITPLVTANEGHKGANTLPHAGGRCTISAARCEGYEQVQERKAEKRKQQLEREQKKHEAERARREKLQKAGVSKFDRIIEKAPAMFQRGPNRGCFSAPSSIPLRLR